MSANKPASRTGRCRTQTRLPLIGRAAPCSGAGYRATLRSVLVGPSVTPRLMRSPSILVFDSGLGGLTVFREIARARPDARLIYAADDALFPYGKVPEDALVARVVGLMGELIAAHRARPRGDRLQHRVDAWCCPRCARASPCPSSAPCRRSSRPARPRTRKLVSVLGTEATVAREYTHALIREFRPGLRRHAGRLGRLAALAEAELARRAGGRRRDRAEIAPCFVDGRRAAHRHHRARLHALPAAARPLRAPRALAGALDRSRRPPIARRVVELIGPATGAHRPGTRRARSSPPAASPPPILLRRLPISGLRREFARAAGI